MCAGLLAIGAVVAVCNWWVIASTRDRVYPSVDSLPDNAVGLVLGTSPYARDGGPNAHFAGRMDTAAAVWAAGKVRHLLLSGANPSERYNEPRAMFEALRDRGVPEQAMTLDFAGFRTLDSLIRAQQIFGLERLTIISQRYHGYRSLFIARHRGLDAVAVAAPTNPVVTQSRRTEIREVFARVKAVLDLYFTAKAPKFLGEREPIELD